MTKRKPTPDETWAMAQIEQAMRQHLPIWKPNVWRALDIVRAELERDE